MNFLADRSVQPISSDELHCTPTGALPEIPNDLLVSCVVGHTLPTPTAPATHINARLISVHLQDVDNVVIRLKH